MARTNIESKTYATVVNAMNEIRYKYPKSILGMPLNKKSMKAFSAAKVSLVFIPSIYTYDDDMYI